MTPEHYRPARAKSLEAGGEFSGLPCPMLARSIQGGRRCGRLFAEAAIGEAGMLSQWVQAGPWPLRARCAVFRTGRRRGAGPRVAGGRRVRTENRGHITE